MTRRSGLRANRLSIRILESRDADRNRAYGGDYRSCEEISQRKAGRRDRSECYQSFTLRYNVLMCMKWFLSRIEGTPSRKLLAMRSIMV